MMTSLVLRYSAFAAIATLANLATQRFVLMGAEGLAVAIFLGTLVGLVVKYVLDKRWIFQDTRGGLSNHSKQFGLYSLMGVATTLIFWGFEYAFWTMWKTDLMRELGAIIGLAIGYVTKYNLDRRFVFVTGANVSAEK